MINNIIPITHTYVHIILWAFNKRNYIKRERERDYKFIYLYIENFIIEKRKFKIAILQEQKRKVLKFKFYIEMQFSCILIDKKTLGIQIYF